MEPTSSDLYWFNIPGLPPKKKFFKELSWQFKYIKNSLDNDTPFYFYMFNGKIDFLEKIKHNADTVNYLNEKGLHIFLNEPIVVRLNDNTCNYTYHDEFQVEYPQDNLKVLEFESIKKYVTNNGLTNITVHTCDYNVEHYHSHYLKYMNLMCDDIFLKNTDLQDQDSPKDYQKFSKKFLCLNWRYVNHRVLTVLYLIEKESLISWYFKLNKQETYKHLWFDIKNFKEKYPDVLAQIDLNIHKLNEKVPLILDIKFKKATRFLNSDGSIENYPNIGNLLNNQNPVAKNINSFDLRYFYKQTFCEVVNESRFAQPTGNYSEKLYQPIKYFTPFILVAPPYTLEYFKSHGFKTFDDYWDETYDECLNHEDRLVKIFKIIDYIDSISVNDLRKIKKDMLPILIHNRRVLEDLIMKNRETS